LLPTELGSSARRTNRHIRRLLVEVTQSQKLSHEEVDCCLESVEAIWKRVMY